MPYIKQKDRPALDQHIEQLALEIKKLAREEGIQGISKLREEDFGSYLWTAGIPDPELIIRTSGEMRTSKFLPWQSAYS